MELLDSLILGILQGITEFLPISSSGHLVLGEHYLELNVATLKSFDVVVHLGTLLAIFVYFWKDLFGMLKVVGRFFIGRVDLGDPYTRLILYVLIGTIPAGLLGIFGEDYIDGIFRDYKMVGICMFAMGFVFLFAEFVYKRRHKNSGLKEKLIEKVDGVRDFVQPGGFEPKEIRGMTWRKAIVIGFAQAFALIPGISRSGSTIAAGLFQGIDRSKAARFSFLLGMPAMFGAGLLTALKIPENGGLGVDIAPLTLGFFTSFVFGLLSVSFLMKFLKNHSLIVFSIYLIALGFGVFVY